MTENLVDKLKPVQSGIFWFGIGSTIIFTWCAYLILALIYTYINATPEMWAFANANNLTSFEQYYQDGVTTLIESAILGWIFLKGKDAFKALESLIREMGEII